jgi:hypothetical protein
MKLHRIEPPHHHRYHRTHDDHSCPESSAKPSERPVHSDFPHPHQRRLQDEENHPSGKCRTVNPQEHWSRRSSMKQIVVDGLAETGHYNRRHEQRYEEVEVSIYQAASAKYS